MKKQVEAVVGTDPHLHVDNIEENKSFYVQAAELCKQYDCPLLLGGDQFEARKAQPLDVLDAFGEILDDLDSKGIVTFAIPGNHDKVSYTSKKSYLDVFKHHPSFFIIDSGGVVIKNSTICIGMIPFFDEKSTYDRYLASYMKDCFDENKDNILVTHRAFNGVKNNDGTIVDGLDINKSLRKFKKIIVGHYHDEQFIEPNIHYIGAGVQHNYGENTKKGFTLIYSDGSLGFVQSEFKQFQSLECEVKSSKDIVELYKYTNDIDSNVRIVIKGPQELLDTIDRKRIESEGFKIECKSNEIKAAIEIAGKEERVSFDKESLLKEFKVFAATENILDVMIGNKYINKCLNKTTA